MSGVRGSGLGGLVLGITAAGLAAFVVPMPGAGQSAAAASPVEERGAEQARAPAAEDSLPTWLATLSAGLARVDSLAGAEGADTARREALELYLEYYERIEGYYGPGGDYAAAALSERVAAGEALFHRLLQATDPQEMSAEAGELRGTLATIAVLAVRAGVPLRPRAPVLHAAPARTGAARTPEVGRILTELDSAATAYGRGERRRALAGVERAYLEGFEPLESRLPAARVARIERLFHLALRPAISRHAADEDVRRGFAALRSELLDADASLERGARFWFGALNSFTIVVREGLEAVLLIGAILAYLAAMDAPPRTRRQIYLGVGAGVGATLVLAVAARTVVPIDGGNRELLEGVTALLAVGVLMYVSNWLFQKTYIHDWKDYLRERVGVAATTGSALAMASLAFAAVFREGFETVLFYQALTFDAGAAAVLAGFVPGLLLIAAIGFGIIRLGVRLPLRKVFAATNAVLLYLAFVFIGKGIYNLQEAGVFAPHPLEWAPDHPALRQLLGFYPIAETLAGQSAFLLLLAATYAWYRRRMAVVVGELGERTRRRRSAA